MDPMAAGQRQCIYMNDVRLDNGCETTVLRCILTHFIMATGSFAPAAPNGARASATRPDMTNSRAAVCGNAAPRTWRNSIMHAPPSTVMFCRSFLTMKPSLLLPQPLRRYLRGARSELIRQEEF